MGNGCVCGILHSHNVSSCSLFTVCLYQFCYLNTLLTHQLHSCLAHGTNFSPGSLGCPPTPDGSRACLGTRQASSIQCVLWVSSTSIPLLIKQSTSRVAGMVRSWSLPAESLWPISYPSDCGFVESRNLVSSNTFSASVMLNTGPAHSKYPGKQFFVFCFFSLLLFPELIPHPLLKACLLYISNSLCLFV